MDRTTFIATLAIVGGMVLFASLPNSMYKADKKVAIVSSSIFLVLSAIVLAIIYHFLKLS
ncbi:hypothetical protein [Pseudanabaena sp. PCC 6802]|uniref:hypothetical protein n=1 Tax=Pseudanabaena sp. PCC 6802 TaxID=118173 RepID=UPI00034AE8C9|nr:hypothetical protein [Pseudanabaena sp. PCC 6802]